MLIISFFCIFFVINYIIIHSHTKYTNWSNSTLVEYPYLVTVILYYLCPKNLPHFPNGFVRKNLLHLCWYHKINLLLFKRGMLNFMKVLRGLKLGSRINPATQFCALSKKMCHEKFIDNYIFIGWRVWTVWSVYACYIIHFSQNSRIVCRGLG